jgi:transposase
VIKRGKVPTEVFRLQELAKELQALGEFVAGQEIGTMAYYVHDALFEVGVKLLSFNAQHLKVICSSRKKTDRRDAYWIAKSLQTSMMPNPVYIPPPRIRKLRQLLALRESTIGERRRWLLRAKSHIRAIGYRNTDKNFKIKRSNLKMVIATLKEVEEHAHLVEILEMCHRHIEALSIDVTLVELEIRRLVKGADEVRRLQSIPGIGPMIAATLYAVIGDVTRFRSARNLCSYVGVVTSVWASSDVLHTGHITKQGSRSLRSMLVQAAVTLYAACRSEAAKPLQAIFSRILTSRTKKKIAVVALARHILRISFYILRDGTTYDPALVSKRAAKDKEEVAIAA